ncbi:MAG: exosortase C-terminal domain/associated protein EpsI [Chthoniobacterales bacterium]
MTTKRLLLLQALLVLGLGAVFLLPKVANSSPQGIELKLPTDVGGWFGEDQKITEMELQVLARDTEFARKMYTNGRGDQIFASIVLSGQDLDNSIHRPERCLPAQGWSIADSRVVKIPIPESPVHELGVTRLHNLRKVAVDGHTVTIYGLNYYWFVGANDITPSHLQRTYIDIRDRILHGYNQRWAYITVAATVTKGLTQFGRSEEETDALIQQFIAELFPKINEGQEQVASRF